MPMKISPLSLLLTGWLGLMPALLPAQAPAPEPKAKPKRERKIIRVPEELLVRMETISLPANEARKALRKYPKQEELYAWLGSELEKEKPQVRLEHLGMVTVRSGHRSKLEEVHELPYATEYDPASIPQSIHIGDTPPAPLPPGRPIPGQGTVIAPGAVPSRLFSPWPYTTCNATSFTFRHLGWTTELEATVSEDGVTVDINMAPEFVRLQGFVPLTPSGEQKQPVFESGQFSGSFLTPPGKPTLAGTLTPGTEAVSPAGERTWLFFTTLCPTEAVRLEAAPDPDRPASGDPFSGSDEMEEDGEVGRDPSADENAGKDKFAPPRETLLRFELISLPPLAARSALLRFPEAPALYSWLEGELGKKDSGVSLEHAHVLRVRSGQRAKVEAITEYPYGTEMDPPQIPQTFSMGPPGSLPVLPAGVGRVFPPWPYTPMNLSSFNFRNTGVTIEAEATVGPDDRTVDLNLAVETVRLATVIPQGLTGEVSQPVFESARSNSQKLAFVDRPALAGTLSPAANTGAPGGTAVDRVWLLFVTPALVD